VRDVPAFRWRIALRATFEVVAATTACSRQRGRDATPRGAWGVDPDGMDGSQYVSLSRPREFADRLGTCAVETH
jgi:hypothetical protein